MATSLPVTLLCGFLGAGKTSLLSHLLAHARDQRLAAVLNDLGGNNIDAQQLRAQRGFSSSRRFLSELNNGCACCGLGQDLVVEATRVAEESRFDSLLIEAAGCADPRALMEALHGKESSGAPLDGHAHLDTLVTVVDARSFLDSYPLAGLLKERSLLSVPEEHYPLAELLAEQVGFANVLVLNKTDLVTPAELQVVEETLARLNPMAAILQAQHGQIDPRKVLNTGRFREFRPPPPAWPRLWGSRPVPQVEKLQLNNFVYTSRRPFHPQRLWRLLQRRWWLGVLRSKGFVWLANRPNVMTLWSQVGSLFQLEPAGLWWGTETTELPEAEAGPGAPVFGACRQEIFFVGRRLDSARLSAALDECLLTDRELLGGPMAWCFLPDPLSASFQEKEPTGQPALPPARN